MKVMKRRKKMLFCMLGQLIRRYMRTTLYRFLEWTFFLRLGEKAGNEALSEILNTIHPRNPKGEEGNEMKRPNVAQGSFVLFFLVEIYELHST